MQFLGLGYLKCDINLFTSSVYEIHLGCGSPHLGLGFLQGLVFAFPTHLKVAILSFAWGTAQLSFRSFSEGIVPYAPLDLLRLWEEVTLGLFYAPILNPSFLE